MKREILLEALKKAGVFPNEEKKSGREIVLADFYEDSLIGKENSSFLREKLILSLGLPQKLSTKSLLRVLNEAYGYETYQKKLEEIVKQAK